MLTGPENGVHTKADLTYANLSDANLSDAYLGSAHNVTQEQLDEAESLEGATAPKGLK